MNLKKMKNVVLILMSCFLFLSTSVSYARGVNEYNDTVLSNEKNITNIIETFFNSYENAFDNEDANFNSIDNYFSSDKISLKNKVLIKTILNRRITLSQEYPDKKLKELNKQLKFDYESINIDKKSAAVTVSVTKTFNYNISLDTQSGERNKYIISLEKGNNWSITNIDGFIDNMIKEDFAGKGIDSEDIESLNEYQKNLRQDVKNFYNNFKASSNTLYTSSNGLIDSGDITILAVSYNRSGAAQYAIDHAYNYNSAYADFSGEQGGDCTNFISQCIHETPGGGIPEHVGAQYSDTCWFYTTSTNRSSSWTGANEFNRYIKSSVSKINASISTFESVDFGDIIQLKYSSGEAYHSLIVTGIVYSSYGRSDLLFCCHTSDRQNYSLSSTFGSGYIKEYIHIIGSK